MKLKTTLLLTCAALVLSSASGCNLFKKSKKPKDQTIAADVEADFRKRWLDRRTSELTAGGMDAGVARAQAENEFHEKYSYLKGEKK